MGFRKINAEEIGDRIKQRREMLRLFQGDVGDKLGVTAAAIGHYERGRSEMSLSYLANLCDALAVEPEWILYGAHRDDSDPQTVCLRSSVPMPPRYKEWIRDVFDSLVNRVPPSEYDDPQT